MSNFDTLEQEEIDYLMSHAGKIEPMIIAVIQSSNDIEMGANLGHLNVYMFMLGKEYQRITNAPSV